MGAMDARRLELYELLKPKLDEEAARKLVLALPPDPETIATKEDLGSLAERMDASIAAPEARMDARFVASEARMDARFSQMEATLTRRMVTIMGAWTILVGSAFGWAAVLLR
jgi:hypothetical protein